MKAFFEQLAPQTKPTKTLGHFQAEALPQEAMYYIKGGNGGSVTPPPIPPFPSPTDIIVIDQVVTVTAP